MAHHHARALAVLGEVLEHQLAHDRHLRARLGVRVRVRVRVGDRVRG